MLKRNLRKTKKGNVTLYITFFIVSIIILMITAILAPVGVLMNTEFYAAGEDIMLKANQSVGNINDATVKESIYGMLDASFDAQENNIAVNNALYQYGWVFMIIIALITVFLASRVLVETKGGFI